MNWGYKILMVYILFVAGIMVMVFMSSTQNTDLVTTDYYEKELVYQQKIDQISRTSALSAKVAITGLSDVKAGIATTLDAVLQAYDRHNLGLAALN